MMDEECFQDKGYIHLHLFPLFRASDCWSQLSSSIPGLGDESSVFRQTKRREEVEEWLHGAVSERVGPQFNTSLFNGVH